MSDQEQATQIDDDFDSQLRAAGAQYHRQWHKDIHDRVEALERELARLEGEVETLKAREPQP